MAFRQDELRAAGMRYDERGLDRSSRSQWPGTMISFRWETVRTFGDAEPAQLEAAIRQVLSGQDATWQVTMGRTARALHLRFESRTMEHGPRTLVTTTIPMPIGPPAALHTTLTQLLVDS